MKTLAQVVMWAGLAVVLLAAAVLSFAALRDLAIAVRIPSQLSWLLPIAIDAGAAVSCAVWLSRHVPADAQTWARGQTWLLLVSTVAGNAGWLGMHAHAVTPPWWVAVLVGAVPPAVVGGTIHLAVLVGRGAGEAGGQRAAHEPAEPPAPLIWSVDELAGLDWPDEDEPAEEVELDDGPPAGGPGDEDPARLPDRRGQVEWSDGAIIADLRAISAARGGRQWGRDEVKRAYGVGSSRAGRILAMVGWPPGRVAGEAGDALGEEAAR